MEAAGRRLGVAIVLDHEDDRQVHGGGEVEALQEGALVRAAVTGERDADLVGATHLGRQADPADQRRATAHNAVGAQHAGGQVGDVHRSALALAGAGGLAVQLGHHGHHVAALRDGVPMAAVGAGDVVGGGQDVANPGRHRLLAGIQVNKAGHLPGLEFLVDALLEVTDRSHGPIRLEQFCCGNRPARGAGHQLLRSSLRYRDDAAPPVVQR